MANQGGLKENESWPGFNSNSDNSRGSGDHHQNPPLNKLMVGATAAAKMTGKSSSSKRKGNDEKGDGKDGGESDHEMHIWTERERRKKMRSMFTSLHALLPQLPPKADKSTIVDEAVNYIKNLELTLQKLQNQKLERIHGLTSCISFDSSSSLLVNPQKLAMDSREAFLADQGSSFNLSNNNNNSIMNISNTLPNYPRYPATSFKTWVSSNVILSVSGDIAQINICCPKRLGLFTAISYFLEKNKLDVVSAQVSSDHYRSMFMIQVQVNGAVDQYSQAFSVDEIFQQTAGEIMSYISTL